MNLYACTPTDPVTRTDPSGTTASNYDIPNYIGQDDIHVIGPLNICASAGCYWVWSGASNFYNGNGAFPAEQAMGRYAMQRAPAPVAPKAKVKPRAPRPQPGNPKKPYGDPFHCLIAVGQGAVNAIVNPTALINDGLTGVAFGAANAARVSSAALPAGRALSIARASGIGGLLSLGLQGAAGGIYSLFTDDRCYNG